MDRLGSRCPLPGSLRPSVLTCLLILTASFVSYPMLRTLSLQLHSAVTGSYVSGTYSVVFVNCPNEQIAREIARVKILNVESGDLDSSVLSGGNSTRDLLWASISCMSRKVDHSGAILDKKLAASVNILPKASSLYFWNGEIEEATEILLLIKTKTSKVHVLSGYIRLVHPFEIPEVFSLPVDQGDVRYFKWLEEGMEED
uniref:protein CutA homolog isoform X2 n=1 Tax=Nyctereutes procyonoides TaxID=34880 RepID=UPI002444F050|nr:protein CutA homolog isoform X2 [Nyctereutes procyonoides]